MSDEKWRKAIEAIEQHGIVAGCVIEQDGTFLLVQEKQEHVKGQWNLPAGRVDDGESAEQAAAREAKEETGFDVSITKHLGVYRVSTDEIVKHTFLADITGGDLQIDPEELLDAQWFDYDDIKQLNAQGKIRDSWVIEAIEKSLGVQS